MRIVGGLWRGRRLVGPAGSTTRPTADRIRQAIFDMLTHASWAPPDGLRGQIVLDAFAGTGALGLEALSRGAARATFIERDPAALAALRANIFALGAAQTRVIAGDALVPPRASEAATLVFLDPPYRAGMPERALAALSEMGWIATQALAVVETGRDERSLPGEAIATRVHGAARVQVLRLRDRLCEPGADTRI